MTSRPKVIEVIGLTRRFGASTAVDNVNLGILENEFFALLGPSGCGKTTLLRMIAGFERPDEGRVHLDGNDITALRPNRRPINLMFQSYALFPHMSVERNISYGLEMERLPKAEITRKVDEIIALTHLKAIRDRKPDQLSGGQRQRVALARALVKKPRVLLLDEPLGALDKKLREQMQLELKRMQHETGITFVVVTHDQEEALVMADRIAVMDQGRIAQLGTPREIYNQPSSLFVADFIGNTNVISGAFESGAVRVNGAGIISGEVLGSPTEGASVSAAVRPESITISISPPQDGAVSIEGRLSALTYHGQDISAHISVHGISKPIVVRLASTDKLNGMLTIGSPVWCRWDASNCRIFDS